MKLFNPKLLNLTQIDTLGKITVKFDELIQGYFYQIKPWVLDQFSNGIEFDSNLMKNFFANVAFNESSFNHYEPDNITPLFPKDRNGNKIQNSSSLGLFQLNAGAETDANNEVSETLDRSKPYDNIELAFIYLFIVIPRYLEHYNKELNEDNIYLGWRWGAKSSKVKDSKTDNSSQVEDGDGLSVSATELVRAVDSKKFTLVITLIIIILSKLVSILKRYK